MWMLDGDRSKVHTLAFLSIACWHFYKLAQKFNLSYNFFFYPIYDVV